MELLGDDCFWGIRADAGSGRVEKHGIVGFDGARLDRVAEADVELHADAHLTQPSLESDAQAAVLRCVADRFGAEGLHGEGHAVVGNLDLTDVADAVPDRCIVRVSVTREVEVARGPVCGTAPDREEHRPLEDERVAMGRDAEPVQEALRRVALNGELRIFSALPGSVQQAPVNGGGPVAGSVGPHGSASK